MTTNAFFSSLPAILGLVGFIVLAFLRHNSRGNATTRQILDKVRRDAPEVARSFQGLSGKQLEKVVLEDQAIKRVLGKRDYEILREALRQQFVLSLVVYVICAALVCFGVLMFLRQISMPQKLQISAIGLASDNEAARGKAVDLDDLQVTWKFAGTPEDVVVYLENAQTNRRSAELRTSSTQERLIFARDTFQACLLERAPGRSNRIRVVCQAKQTVFRSDEFDLRVGVNIWGFYDQEKRSVRLAAMIDHALVQEYPFEAKITVWTKEPAKLLSFGGTVRGQADFPIENPEAIRWDTIGIVYLGPGDASLVRATIEPI